MHRTAAETLTAYSSSQSPGVASSHPRLANAAALLTSMSAPPPVSTSKMNRSQSSGYAISAIMPRASPPSALIASVTA